MYADYATSDGGCGVRRSGDGGVDRGNARERWLAGMIVSSQGRRSCQLCDCVCVCEAVAVPPSRAVAGDGTERDETSPWDRTRPPA